MKEGYWTVYVDTESWTGRVNRGSGESWATWNTGNRG